jgi:hypothetical protein
MAETGQAGTGFECNQTKPCRGTEGIVIEAIDRRWDAEVFENIEGALAVRVGLDFSKREGKAANANTRAKG